MSAESLLQVVELLPGPALVVGPGGEILGANDRAERWIGLGRDQLRGRPLARLVSDASGRPDPVEDFKVINRELENFGHELLQKPMIVAATKIDSANPEKLKKLSAHARRRKLEFHAISSVTGQGIDELKWALAKRVRPAEG